MGPSLLTAVRVRFLSYSEEAVRQTSLLPEGSVDQTRLALRRLTLAPGNPDVGLAVLFGMESQLCEEQTELRSLIDALRDDDGRLFRAILRRLKQEDRAHSLLLAEALVSHPNLRDLVPH
jgi:hypothetical protein